MRKLNIAIVTGGNSAEVGIAFKGAAVVSSALNSDRFTGYRVIIEGVNWFVDFANEERPIDKNDFSFQLGEQKIVFDCAFVVIHGDPAENGKLQGYFDMIGLPYTCSGVLSSALTFDKSACKTFLSRFEIPMAGSICFHKGDDMQIINQQIRSKLKFPVFVKPNREGSSYGISKVNEYKALTSAIQKSLEYDDEVLVEEFIEGREITGALIRKNGVVIAFPMTEIVTSNDFFDYKAKYEGQSDEITPADIPEALTKACQTLSKLIYRELNCKGMVRIDYILRNDVFHLLEVNTIPGLSAESILPQQAESMGMGLRELFEAVIEETMKQ